MIGMLREQREAWQDPSSREAEFIEISPRQIANPYFVDGVFACGLVQSGEIRTRIQNIDEIHFHRLQSFNKNTSYKHWHHRNFGFPIEAFAIQPEIDLLVLVEGVVLERVEVVRRVIGFMRRAYKSYRLHFQTMSANTPHFLASLSLLDTGLGGVSSLDESLGTQLTISLNGRMIMLTGSTNHSTTERTIGVWDWVEGIEISRIIVPAYPLPGYPETSCCHSYLLSEEYLIVFSVAQHGIDESSPPTIPEVTKPGHFDIYRLRSELNGALRVARFELPGISAPQTKRDVTMSFGPAKLPWTPCWLTKLQYVPRVYETAPQSRMFCLLLAICIIDPLNPESTSHQNADHFLLHIPVQTLLTHLETRSGNCPTVIPWSDWGAQVCWVETTPWSFPYVGNSNVSDLRHSIRSFNYYTNPDDQIKKWARDPQAILDFDPQRIRFMGSVGRKTPNDENHSPCSASDEASRAKFMARLAMSTSGNPMFETPVNLASSYSHMSLNIEPLLPMDPFRISCLTGDEHIIVIIQGYKEMHRTPPVGILVYTP